MKLNQTVPLISLAAVAPPLAIGAAIGLGLIWLLSKDEQVARDLAPLGAAPAPVPATNIATVAPSSAVTSRSPSRRVTREDLAEALEYGTRSMLLGEAVAALQALGFGKTAAYKALSVEGKFCELLEHTQDGLVEWVG